MSVERKQKFGKMMRVEQSRIPKIESVPPQHLVLTARTWFFRQHHEDIRTKDEIDCILHNAKRRGSEEAAWILERDGNFNDGTPRGLFYFGAVTFGYGATGQGMLLLRESANLGYPPAMSKLGFYLSMFGAKDEGDYWIDAGAAKGDYDGLLLKGKTHAYDMGSNYSIPSTVPKHIVYNGRYWVLNQPGLFLCSKPVSYLERYEFGREIEGYNQLWANVRLPADSLLLEWIELYLTNSHFYRRAALQTLVALRIHNRDCARIVAKMVYDFRGTEIPSQVCSKSARSSCPRVWPAPGPSCPAFEPLPAWKI